MLQDNVLYLPGRCRELALLSIRRLPVDCHSDCYLYSPHFEDGSVEPPTSGATPAHPLPNPMPLGNIYQAPSEAAPPVLSLPLASLPVATVPQ